MRSRAPISLRLRLLLLVAAALLPIAVLASLVVWRDNRAIERQPLRVAGFLVEFASARQEIRREDAEGVLGGLLAGLPSGPADDCAMLIEAAAAAMPNRFAAISRFDPNGRLICRATRPGAASPLIRLRHLVPAGSIVAELRADIPPPTPQRHIWLVEAGSVPSGADEDFPDEKLFRRLLEIRSEGQVGSTRTGRAAAFASRAIAPDLTLIASVSLASGTAVPPLLSTATILVMVAASLLLITLGVERLVVRPMRRLQSSVRRWRGGAEANAADAGALPRELRDLALAFEVTASALAEREHDLRGALAQQDLLMHEIHHRVKNNLQIVASLLNLQASRIRQPEARAEFQSARDRVRALATLHRHLYGHGELHTINMHDFLEELCAQLFRGLQEEPGERIALEIEATELQMTSDQAVPIALIVTETVSNALKFAFPERQAGRIHVSLTEPAGAVRLVIEDDGVGFPPEGEGAPTGIGRQLIRGFARQLDARLTISAEHGVRYDFEIRLPQPTPAAASSPTAAPAIA